MVEYVNSNSFNLKVDQPKWVPSKTKYLDTFFAEHSQIVGAMCNNPQVNGDQVEMFVRALLSLITSKEKRAECMKDVAKNYDKYCRERAKLRSLEDINQLSNDDTSHCYKLAWLDVLGEIMDVQSKTYHVEGNEQSIGVFGMRGFDKDGNPALLMSTEKLNEILGKKAREVEVGGDNNGS